MGISFIFMEKVLILWGLNSLSLGIEPKGEVLDAQGNIIDSPDNNPILHKSIVIGVLCNASSISLKVVFVTLFHSL